MKWKILDNMSTMECIEPQTNEELKKKFINLHIVHCALFTVALGYSRDTKIRNSCLVSIIENLFKNHCSLQFEKKKVKIGSVRRWMLYYYYRLQPLIKFRKKFKATSKLSNKCIDGSYPCLFIQHCRWAFVHLCENFLIIELMISNSCRTLFSWYQFNTINNWNMIGVPSNFQNLIVKPFTDVR